MSEDIHSFSGGSGAMAGDTLPILRREHRRRSNHGECTATITCRAAWHANHQLGEPPEGWNYAKLLVWQKCFPDLSSISAKPKPNNEVISLVERVRSRAFEAFATLFFCDSPWTAWVTRVTWHIWLQIDLADQTRKTSKNLLHEIPRECFSTVVHGKPPFPPSSKRHERNPPSVLCWLWTGVSSNRSQGGFHGCPSSILDRTPRAKHCPLQNTSFGRRDGETNLGFH